MADHMASAFAGWRGDADDACVAQAPGRVNLIGEHTDYNEGFVLPMTLDCAVYAAARRTSGDMHQLRSFNFDEEVAFPVGAMPDVAPGHWASYAGGMLLEMSRHSGRAPAFAMMLKGNVPLGAGLSSSAALAMAIGLAVECATGQHMAPLDMAKIGQRVEHTYAHVQCGIMDQAVSRLGRSAHALFLDCRSLQLQHVPLPLNDVSIVVIDSGVRRQLASSKYNERRAECAEALAHCRRIIPGLKALRDIHMEDLDQLIAGLSQDLQSRARHVVEENARVERAVAALETGDLDLFGLRLGRSHASLRDLYAVSCPELDFLVDAAHAMPGTLGARMTGGGFGGCAVSVVRKQAVPAFVATVPELYAREFDRSASVYVVENNLEAEIIWRA